MRARTVRDAIAYGRPDATDAEVEAAAREVGAIEMIARLPGGFRHEVAERGRNLAAGQRQLIALARAYLVDPAILLLDEATAALDLASEAAVNTATERLAVAKPTLTATADGLVAAGYAQREAEPGDRRVVRLCLTAAGRAALERADAAYAGWLGPLLGATGDMAGVLEAFRGLDAAMDERRRARLGLA